MPEISHLLMLYGATIMGGSRTYCAVQGMRTQVSLGEHTAEKGLYYICYKNNNVPSLQNDMLARPSAPCAFLFLKSCCPAVYALLTKARTGGFFHLRMRLSVCIAIQAVTWALRWLEAL